MVNHLALVTTETLPQFDVPCAGGGVRAWGIGERLRKNEIKLTYFLREETPGLERIPKEIPHVVYRPEQLAQTIHEWDCDAALFEQWQPMTFLKAPLEIPTFVDLPGPLFLEYYWRDPENYFQHAIDKLDCLSRADYFLCALERQRGYYEAWLTWAGVSPDANRLTVVPFMFDEMPVGRFGHTEDEPLLFWGGMFWPWQERWNAFDTILNVLVQNRRGQLVVAGSDGTDEHARHDGRNYAEHPHISWLGQLCFTEYIAEVKRSAVAIDLSKPTEERRLSSDLRTGTALWAGTPCIVTPESPWCAFIEEHNAGWIIAYGDHKTLINVMKEIVLERGDIVSKRRGARTVSEHITQKTRMDQLLAWLENPTKRESSPTLIEARTGDREKRVKAMQEEIDHLRHERDCLQHDLNAIRSNPLFKLYKTLKFWD